MHPQLKRKKNNLVINELDLFDLARVERMCQKFPLPNTNDENNFLQEALIYDHCLVGAVFGKLTSEISLVLDENLSKFSRAYIIRELFSHLFPRFVHLGLKDTHLFLLPEDDQDHVNLLTKHFNFVKATGTCLYLGW